MRFNQRTCELLNLVGLSHVEIKAAHFDPILTVDDKPSGFGLVGPTGTGKTIYMAHRLAVLTDAIVQNAERQHEAKYPCGESVLWMNWPESAELFKRWAVSDDPRHTETQIDHAKSVGNLYLDDLGQERSKGEDDLSTAILREILDSRYRDGLPVFWTSNLDKIALANFYGARTISRMAEAWPGQRVTGQDIRLQA